MSTHKDYTGRAGSQAKERVRKQKSIGVKVARVAEGPGFSQTPYDEPCCEAGRNPCDAPCELCSGGLDADAFADAVNALQAAAAATQVPLCALAHSGQGASLICACAARPSEK